MSLGYPSSFEDVDRLLQVISSHFLEPPHIPSHVPGSASNSSASVVAVDHQSRNVMSVSDSVHATASTVDVCVAAIYVYPIKSCAAMSVRSWPMNMATGALLYDR